VFTKPIPLKCFEAFDKRERYIEIEGVCHQTIHHHVKLQNPHKHKTHMFTLIYEPHMFTKAQVFDHGCLYISGTMRGLCEKLMREGFLTHFQETVNSAVAEICKMVATEKLNLIF
jgi:hypothetical protein